MMMQKYLAYAQRHLYTVILTANHADLVAVAEEGRVAAVVVAAAAAAAAVAEAGKFLASCMKLAFFSCEFRRIFIC